MGFQDCLQPGCSGGAELFLVEGDSAAKAVLSVRDPATQAVFPMQGKPANALKTSPRLLRENLLFKQLHQALGYTQGATCEAEKCNFQRIVMLFDPDADGIHCGALMLMFFVKLMPELLETGHVCLARPPLFEVKYAVEVGTQLQPRIEFAFLETELRPLLQTLQKAGATDVSTNRIRGLAGMRRELLAEMCVDPLTRQLYIVRTEDARAAIDVFCGSL